MVMMLVVVSMSMVMSAVLIFLVQILDFGDFSFALIRTIFSAFAPWTTTFTRRTRKAASIPTALALVRRDSVFTTLLTWFGWLRGFCRLRHPLSGFRRLNF